MEATVTTHRAINAEGRPVQYYNVLRYQCPQGCPTATFDFSEASLDPGGRERGFRLHAVSDAGRDAAVAEPVAGGFDLALAITVAGLLLGYLMFSWALFTIPALPAAKIVLAALLTLSAFYILVHVTTKPEPRPPAPAVERVVSDAES